MVKNILILGASGTVGTAVFQMLSRRKELHVVGTFFSAGRQESPSMRRFALGMDLLPLLRQVRPDVIVSALRGDFGEQLSAHETAADYLKEHGGKMIFLSTVNVFDGSMDRPHYEEDPREPASGYGRFKMQCEDLLRERLNRQAVILRLPFVWGRNSPRMQAVSAGCAAGQLEVYDIQSNHASDLQAAELIEWIILEDQSGTFHVGTQDVIDYRQFIERLIAAMGAKKPRFVQGEAHGVMAALNSRTDLPHRTLSWDSERLIQYLCTP